MTSSIKALEITPESFKLYEELAHVSGFKVLAINVVETSFILIEKMPGIGKVNICFLTAEDFEKNYRFTEIEHVSQFRSVTAI